jgi:hypothetical protein
MSNYSVIPKSTTFPKNNLIIAENTYRILENGILTTGKNLFADKFTDSNGVKNTLNTGSSTAVFTSNNYHNLQNATESGGSTNTSGGDSGTQVITGTATARGYFKQIGWLIAYSNTTRAISLSVKKNGVEVLNYSNASYNGEPTNLNFTADDYSELFESGDTISITMTDARNVEKANTGFSGSMFSIDKSVRYLVFQQEDYLSSSVVIADSNTITFNNTENTLCLYGDCEIPVGTSITYDISDGTTTLSNNSFGDDVDISSLSTGSAKVTFNLNSDGTDTPIFYGYSGIVIR